MTSAVSRLCAIHQPNLLPRLSTLAKLRAADVWVVLDDVQFTRRDYQHRARLGPWADPSAQRWMSLSVTLPYGRSTRITDVRVVDAETCRRRVSRLTRQLHGHGPHWRPVGEEVERVAQLMAETDRLAEIAIASTESLLKLVGWKGQVVRSSDIEARAERSLRLVDLTLAVNADTYLCGTGGARYLNEDAFAAHDLRVRYCSPPGAWKEASRLSAVAALAEHGGPRIAEAFSAGTTNPG